MALGRRDFLGYVGAIPFVGALSAFADGKPLLRMGVMTDTHIRKTKKSCGRVKLAYELFRRHGVDLMVNVGDVADNHYPTGYKAYRETIEEVFAGVPAAERPEELFVYAGHDFFNYGGVKKSRLWYRDATPAFADMERLIGAKNGPYAQGSVKGFPYVVFPQSMTEGLDFKRCEKMIADAVAANPGKPVFVFAHVPPHGTTRNGTGSREAREIFGKYPQIVNFSGHTHGSLVDERAIWQGEFTSVNVGCLHTWAGRLVGNNNPRRDNYGVLIVDVFASRIVFRRFDVRDGKEYKANDPWMIPWPFDPSTAPYRAASRKEKNMVPAFVAGTSLKVAATGDEGNVMLTVPNSCGELRPYIYRVNLERLDGNGKWKPLGRRDFVGDAWQRPHERPEKYDVEVPGAYFKAGGKYRFRVFPLNSWRNAGSPLTVEFTAPESKVKPQVVWQSDNPAKDCRCFAGLEGSKSLPLKDGFYEMGEGGIARLEFPEGAWKGARGTKFRFIVDVHTLQEGPLTWTMVLRNPNPRKNAHGRITTPDGDSGSIRYVIDFEKEKAGFAYYLLVREGGAGRIRFDRVRIERLQ
jgi:hypothetical protein